MTTKICKKCGVEKKLSEFTKYRYNGELCLDHIIPRSDLLYTFMNEESFCKCWSLSNLRPLSAKQNIIEGPARVRHKKVV